MLGDESGHKPRGKRGIREDPVTGGQEKKLNHPCRALPRYSLRPDPQTEISAGLSTFRFEAYS